MAGTTALVLSLVGTAAQIAGQMQQGRAQGRAYEAQASVDDANWRNKAKETSLNEDTLRRKQRQDLAKIAGAQNEAGLVGGTAFGSYMQSLKNAEQDALNLRYEGMSQVQNYKNSAMLNRAYGKQARLNARNSAWATGITGAASSLIMAGKAGYLGENIANKFKGF
ncbi:MAG: hypothetical protein J5601_02750 [Elusimicrobiaceae bacterium]|nr:hypothetical protein [Elusimicrobiaceae bacterium]